MRKLNTAFKNAFRDPSSGSLVRASQILMKAERGEVLSVDEISSLLNVKEGSEEAYELFEISRSLADKLLHRRGRIWCAIGLDYRPCEAKCNFCSLSKWWGLVKEVYEISKSDALKLAKSFIERGAHYIVLRTTEFYSPAKLVELGLDISSIKPRDVKLVANTGEVDISWLRRMKEAGFEGLYHTIRLREGIDTGIKPEVRLRTIKAIREAGLKLYYLVEPIGPEHTHLEIAQAIDLMRKLRPSLIGAMARIPVPNTPLAHYG
ncbi:MAG: radical SAM protein, partial [Candidatus Nezhaarchaeales archaeon]